MRLGLSAYNVSKADVQTCCVYSDVYPCSGGSEGRVWECLWGYLGGLLEFVCCCLDGFVMLLLVTKCMIFWVIETCKSHGRSWLKTVFGCQMLHTKIFNLMVRIASQSKMLETHFPSAGLESRTRPNQQDRIFYKANECNYCRSKVKNAQNIQHENDPIPTVHHNPSTIPDNTKNLALLSANRH